MFGGSPLNRLSWLRTSHSFLNAAIVSPASRWLLFNSGQPLVTSKSDHPSKQTLAYLTTNDVRPFLGSEPFFGQGKDEGQLVIESEQVQHSPTEAVRHRNIPVVFLGLLEVHSKDSPNALPSSDFKDPEDAIANLSGTPYFSIDIAGLDWTSNRLQEVLKTTSLSQAGQVLSWSEPRVLMASFDKFSGAVFAEAKSLVDWNHRNKVCIIVIAPKVSAGGDIFSGSFALPVAHRLIPCGAVGRFPAPHSCHGRIILIANHVLPGRSANKHLTVTVDVLTADVILSKGLHNFTHPRTDAVVIMVAIDEAGDKILLGRGRKFPGKFYSALAGFIEPGETFEDAVVREMWEEAGVTVWDIRYHSGQPWPYPASLMVGFYARADPSQPIRTDLDNELVDARWYTRAEILSVLNHPVGTTLSRTDHKKLAESTEGKNHQSEAPNFGSTNQTSGPAVQSATIPNQVTREDPPFRLPPVTAIAGVLIRDWAEGKMAFTKESRDIIPRGNL